MSALDLEDGMYWVRCSYTDRRGETAVYMTQYQLFNKHGVTALDVKHHVEKLITQELGGTNLSEITFRSC